MTRVFSGLLFVGVGLILAGFAVAMFFEAFAILTGREPTLSALSASAIAQHPHLALLFTLLVGILIGALVTHFTNWKPLPPQ